MKLLSFAFIGFLFIAIVKEGQSSLVDDLDDARAAMLNIEKKITAATSKSSRSSRTLTAAQVNHNKRNDACFQIERAMIDATLLRSYPPKHQLVQNIKRALNNGNVMYARQALGLGLYVASKSATGRRRKRTVNPFLTFLNEIDNLVGNDKIEELFSSNGEATLMFAMDITGSMGQEIDAAKDMVTAISDYANSNSVDFILSSFGDPIEQGGQVYKKKGKVEEFKAEVGKLKASGGGDCAEYAYNGMLNIFTTSEEGPKMGSPLYLFTDATPKDASEVNIEVLQGSAKEYETTINVFAWKDCYQGPHTFDHFKDLATHTGGQFLELKSKDLRSISTSIVNALGGSTTVTCGSSDAGAVGKRSVTRRIPIDIDETVANLVLTVTAANSVAGNNVKLFSPTGALWTTGRSLFDKVVIYVLDIPSPAPPGTWTLVISPSAGAFTYSAKGRSSENTDFLYNYLKEIKGKMVPVQHPLAGEDAHVRLALSKVDNLVKSSLKLDIVDLTGRTLQTISKLTEVGKDGRQFTARFRPPSNQEFKLKLRARTTGGNSFERVSQFVSKAKQLLLKVFFTTKYFTIPQRGIAQALLYLYNSSPKRQCCTVVVKDNLKYNFTVYPRNRVCVRAGSKRLMRLVVRANGAGKTGASEKIVVIATTTETPHIVTSEIIPLMVV